MDVTYKTVGEVIADCFTSKPQVSNDYVAFTLDADDFILEIVITLRDEVIDEDDERTSQTMGISMWFCGLDKKRLDFSHFDFTALLYLCYNLQAITPWGTLVPVQLEGDVMGVKMFRCLDISLRDVSSALHEGLDSPFLRALSGMSSDCHDIAQELLISNQQKMHSMEDVELFLDPASGTA